MPLTFQVFAEGRPVLAGESPGPLEIGRQNDAEEPLLSLYPMKDGVSRLAVTELTETSIGRRQLRVEQLPDARLRLTNGSTQVPVTVREWGELGPRMVTTLSPPVTVSLSGRVTVLLGEPGLEVRSVGAGHLESLGEATIAPGRAADGFSSLLRVRPDWTAGSDAEQLLRGLGATIDLLQGAREPSELFAAAVRAAVKLAGLDRAVLLLREESGWKPAASADTGQNRSIQSGDRPVSRTVLRHVAEQKRTFWETGSGALEGTLASLVEIEAVIAAPILDPEGSVIGSLYGDRRSGSAAPPTRLEARLVELLACAVASGLARMTQQKEVQRLRVRFDQFFGPELASELEANPDMLAGRDADVSILFCDIRQFSRIAERIGTASTFAWIGETLGVLSECVIRHGGVLVDYVGDEVMAMWGAPRPQPDHAQRACRAGLDMLAAMPTIDARWSQRLGESTEVGIGISSGPVRAGNTGSERKFKYGPLGNTVNLASRVQGLNKYLRTNLLITGGTADKLATESSEEFYLRRLCQTEVVNIREPVRLFELAASGRGSSHQKTSYEAALDLFEKREFRPAARAIAPLLGEFPDDGPSLVLLKRTVDALVDGPDDRHPLWMPPGK